MISKTVYSKTVGGSGLYVIYLMATSKQNSAGVSQREATVPVDREVYTAFSRREQRLIIGLLGAAMLASPLSATMYLPLLPLLSQHFHTSIQAINLTITVYITFTALSPLFLASTSDYFGRRPIYISTFVIYTLASLGLALNTSSYPALLILRALQSIGAGAVLSLSYASIADVCVPARRGKLLGQLLALSNLGTCVGPIVGGWIALASGSYKWAFWALCIFGGLILSALVIMLPETARNVVGNGIIQDRKWNQSVWSLLCNHQQRSQAQQVGPRKDVRETKDIAQDSIISQSNLTEPQGTTSSQPQRSFKIKSPLDVLRIFFYKDAILTIWIQASYYALWYCVQTNIPVTFKASPYHFTELQVGLAYLPGATGVILSKYATSHFIDRNYKAAARKIGFTVDKVKGDDLTKFPIEKARTRWCGTLTRLTVCTAVAYGWCIDKGVHIAVPLILQFLQAFLGGWVIQATSVLLVDIFPKVTGTASTTGNIARYALAAIAVAVLEPLIDVIGRGWTFTILGLLSGLGSTIALAILGRWGMRWRNSRNMKDNEVQLEGV